VAALEAAIMAIVAQAEQPVLEAIAVLAEDMEQIITQTILAALVV
jgi:hypothetical protein